jgi:hypothetical protein
MRGRKLGGRPAIPIAAMADARLSQGWNFAFLFAERHTCEIEVEAKLADAVVTCCEEDMTVNSRQIDGAELRKQNPQCAHETKQHSVSESMRQSETSCVARFSVTRIKMDEDAMGGAEEKNGLSP